MKILVTGTHFTPARAVISKLLAFPDTEVVYVGRKYTQEGDKSLSVESKELPALGVKFIPLIAGRLSRFISFYSLMSVLKIPIGFISAFYLIAKERPDVVLSFGGYVGLPVVVSAWLLSKPIIVHEQTLVSGLSNKISIFFAGRVAVSFNTPYPFSKNKLILTGNPIRQELLESGQTVPAELRDFLKLKTEFDLKLILITGGNQGSHIINERIGEIIEKLTDRFLVIHQTGESRFNDFEKLSEIRLGLKNPERYLLKKWIDVESLAVIFKKADLAIGRAGINTLVELALFKVLAVVVPIPYLYGNEQMKNARFFERLGWVKVLPQSELTANHLLRVVLERFKNLEEVKSHCQKVNEVVIKDAASRLAQETLLIGMGDV